MLKRYSNSWRREMREGNFDRKTHRKKGIMSRESMLMW